MQRTAIRCKSTLMSTFSRRSGLWLEGRAPPRPALDLDVSCAPFFLIHGLDHLHAGASDNNVNNG